MNPSNFNFYTCPQFAARVGCSPRYARAWLRDWAQHNVPGTRARQHVRLFEHELEEALAAWEARPRLCWQGSTRTARDFAKRVGCREWAAWRFMRRWKGAAPRQHVYLTNEEFEACVRAWEVTSNQHRRWQPLRIH